MHRCSEYAWFCNHQLHVGSLPAFALGLHAHLMNHSGGSAAAAACLAASTASGPGLLSLAASLCAASAAAAAACSAATSILPGCPAAELLWPPPESAASAFAGAGTAPGCAKLWSLLLVRLPSGPALNFDTRDRLMMPLPCRLSASRDGRCAMTVAAPMANTCEIQC